MTEMRRIVTYEAADRATGFTPAELREALARAVSIERVWVRGFPTLKPWRIDVEESPEGVRVGLDSEPGGQP